MKAKQISDYSSMKGIHKVHVWVDEHAGPILLCAIAAIFLKYCISLHSQYDPELYPDIWNYVLYYGSALLASVFYGGMICALFIFIIYILDVFINKR
jgi:hypothetical protein